MTSQGVKIGVRDEPRQLQVGDVSILVALDESVSSINFNDKAQRITECHRDMKIWTTNILQECVDPVRRGPAPGNVPSYKCYIH